MTGGDLSKSRGFPVGPTSSRWRKGSHVASRPGIGKYKRNPLTERDRARGQAGRVEGTENDDRGEWVKKVQKSYSRKQWVRTGK